MRFVFNILILLFLFIHYIYPQIGVHSNNQKLLFEHYTTDDGLSSPIVRSIIQDKTGYLWLGTYSGLDRYDGISFKSYKNILGDTLSITNGFVQCLLEDRAGYIWVGTTNGLDKFNPSNETFLHYKPFPDSNSNPWSNNILSLCEDQFGFIWAGTGDGLNRFDPVSKTFIHFRNDTSDKNSLINNLINALLVDRNGTLWIGTGNGIDHFDRVNEKFIHYWRDTVYREGYYDGGLRNKYRINALYEDEEGIIWACTQNGLLEINKTGNEFILYDYDINKTETISYYATTSICEEGSDGMWIGTWNGFNYFDKTSKKFTRIYHNSKDINSVSHNSIAAVFRERSGTLWVTTFGGGVDKVNRTIYPFKVYSEHSWKEINRFSSAPIMDISKGRDGRVWIATPTGLQYFDPKTETIESYKIDYNIRVVHEDRKGNLWIANNQSSGRGLYKIEANGQMTSITDYSGNKLNWLVNQIIEDDDDSILWCCTSDQGGIVKINSITNRFVPVYYSPTTVNTIHKDRKGIIWIGTRESGLLGFDPLTNKIVYQYISDYKNPESISGNSIMSIFEDKLGYLWLGTNMGLNKFDFDKGTFKHFTESDGLPHNWVYLIFEDNNKNLWLSTNKGVTKFNPVTETFNNYDVLHGLIAADRSGIGCMSDQGEIYLDSPRGLTRFHPDDIFENPYIPPIVITNVLVDGKVIKHIDELILSYNKNNITFEFAALSYVRPEKNLYAHKLEGLDKEWIHSGNIRYASYTNLNPGEYLLKVKGSNNDGVWNEAGVSLKLVIRPPWYGSTIAYLIYSVLLIGLLYAIWKAQLTRIKIRHEYEISKLEAHKLQEVDQIKTRFFTNISHEFRTPLTLIMGPAKQILSRSKDQNIKDDVKMIYRNAGKINRLVDELLELSKIESGKMALKAAPRNLVLLVSNLVLSFQSFAERKNISLSLSSDEKEIITYLDSEKFERIISNLISNGLKFTPYGGRVSVIIKKTESYAEIAVVDTGVGIANENIEKIFDRFFQIDASHTREQEGTGIGLALTKELIDLHKFKIEVGSEEGKGSTFKVTVPLGSEHLNPQEISGETYQEETDELISDLTYDENDFTEADGNIKTDIETLTDHTIPVLLIVEDNYEVRKYIKSIIAKEYKIYEARNGREGLEKAFRIMPDLIISDIMMPVMDGTGMCRQLKSDERTSHIPVIMLTAKATVYDKVEALETGADEYLYKPFDDRELRARIKNLIEQRKRLHEHFHKCGLFAIKAKNLNQLDKLFIEKVVDIINKNMSDVELGVEMLVNLLSVSKTVLNKKIAALTGYNPAELIRRVRMCKAEKMIGQRAGNISEIAYEVGFSNPAYFAECFKKEFGVSPSHYQSHGNEKG